MGTILTLGLLTVVCYYSFRHGKRVGSQLAYRIGRRHGRQRRLH
jgi:hypothetical protein